MAPAQRAASASRASRSLQARQALYRDLVLEAAEIGSIQRGTPVYHRSFPAGEVAHYELGEGDGPARVRVVIAEAFAARVQSEIDIRPQQEPYVVRAFELALGRQPTATELAAALPVMREHGLSAVCRALFNSNEFLFLP